MNCRDVRNELTLHPTTSDAPVQTHLATCAACTAHQQRQVSFDNALRAEVQWQAPATLTAQLLALTAGPLLGATPRPKTWYVRLVYVLTLLAVSCSVLIGWHFVGMLAGQFGFNDALTWLVNAPSLGLARLTELLPQASYAVDFFLRVRDQLLWLLFAAVLWAALDRRGGRGAARQGA